MLVADAWGRLSQVPGTSVFRFLSWSPNMYSRLALFVIEGMLAQRTRFYVVLMVHQIALFVGSFSPLSLWTPNSCLVLPLLSFVLYCPDCRYRVVRSTRTYPHRLCIRQLENLHTLDNTPGTGKKTAIRLWRRFQNFAHKTSSFTHRDPTV